MCTCRSVPNFSAYLAGLFCWLRIGSFLIQPSGWTKQKALQIAVLTDLMLVRWAIVFRQGDFPPQHTRSTETNCRDWLLLDEELYKRGEILLFSARPRFLAGLCCLLSSATATKGKNEQSRCTESVQLMILKQFWGSMQCSSSGTWHWQFGSNVPRLSPYAPFWVLLPSGVASSSALSKEEFTTVLDL